MYILNIAVIGHQSYLRHWLLIILPWLAIDNIMSCDIDHIDVNLILLTPFVFYSFQKYVYTRKDIIML